jgi:hypothetical protein
MSGRSSVLHLVGLYNKAEALTTKSILSFKAACLQIHANFHENFENVFKSKIL